MEAVAGLGLILSLLAIIVAVLWILLPFAVFGIKDLAKTLIAEQKVTNKQLILLAEQTPSPDTHVKCPDCRELVIKDAKKCKHCGSALVPQ